jgi:hypothetical protein
MNNHAGRLVDDHEVVIVVENLQGKLFGSAKAWNRRRNLNDNDPVRGAQPIRGLHSASFYLGKASYDELLKLVAGRKSAALLEKPVKARADGRRRDGEGNPLRFLRVQRRIPEEWLLAHFPLPPLEQREAFGIEPSAGFLKIARHLFDEPLNRLKAALVPQAVHELHAEGLAVEVFVKVQQVDLDGKGST